MDKSKTKKDEIIEASLDLFSENGYDAVSTRMIARAVNASDAVIYKHFKNKQEILNTIVEDCISYYQKKISKIDIQTVSWKDIENICIEMFKIQTTDSKIVKFRRLLIVEQYKNETMKKIYKNIFIEYPLKTMCEIFRELIDLGYMKKNDPEVYAMELYAPFFMYHTIGGDSEVLIQKLKAHVTNFRKNVITNDIV